MSTKGAFAGTAFSTSLILAVALLVACLTPASAQSTVSGGASQIHGLALEFAQNAATPGAAPNDTGYRLGSGDRVHIIVFGQNDLTGDYQVDGSGMLQFPLIGQVHAGGMTAAELQQAIMSKLSPDYIRNPSVSVEVMNYRPFFIVGEVNKAGSYPYVSGMTVLNAVALAGGFTYRAKDSDFKISRMENGQRVTLDANNDTPVLPGDIITIPERFF
jgi:protein involved in polysaccharide export with SLBB domain